LILLLATPAEAHCYRIWHYPWEQKCAVEKTITRTIIGSKIGVESNESGDSSQGTLSSMRKPGFSNTPSGLHSPAISSMAMSETSRGSSRMENVLFKTELERIVDFPIPPLDWDICPNGGERLQGIARLRALGEDR
jgi:hypothetical protein